MNSRFAHTCFAPVMLLLWAVVVSAQAPPAATGPEADVLKKELGTWDAEMTVWMGGPESEPATFPASEVNSMMGPWLISKFESNFGGMEFKGHAQMCYDPIKKKLVGTWIDSMSPHLNTMEGTYDPETRSTTTISSGIDAQTGEMNKSRAVTKYIDDDTKVMKMFMLDPETEAEKFKAFEIKYTRQKS